MLTLTRKYTFSAAHRLWNPAFSESENEAHFGACVRVHGHNYVLEVTISGKPHPKTGMMMDIIALDQLIQSTLLDHIDHYHLEEDVDFLKGTLTTVENLAAVFYHKLQPTFPKEISLEGVRLYENTTNWAEMTQQELVTV